MEARAVSNSGIFFNCQFILSFLASMAEILQHISSFVINTTQHKSNGKERTKQKNYKNFPAIQKYTPTLLHCGTSARFFLSYCTGTKRVWNANIRNVPSTSTSCEQLMFEVAPNTLQSWRRQQLLPIITAAVVVTVRKGFSINKGRRAMPLCSLSSVWCACPCYSCCKKYAAAVAVAAIVLQLLFVNELI